jgi:hypothetical protein
MFNWCLITRGYIFETEIVHSINNSISWYSINYEYTIVETYHYRYPSVIQHSNEKSTHVPENVPFKAYSSGIFPWFSHSKPFSYDFPMMFLWCSYDVPMIFLWFSYDFPMIVLYFVGEFPQHMTRCPSSHGIPGIREARLATSPQVRHGIGLHQDLTVKSEVYQMGPIRRYHRWDNIQYISYHI